jgi:hypothetical protein
VYNDAAYEYFNRVAESALQILVEGGTNSTGKYLLKTALLWSAVVI